LIFSAAPRNVATVGLGLGLVKLATGREENAAVLVPEATGAVLVDAGMGTSPML
jgi:hypothetical protein